MKYVVSCVTLFLFALAMGLPTVASACGSPQSPPSLPVLPDTVMPKAVSLYGRLSVLRSRCPDAVPIFELNADGRVFRLDLPEELRKSAIGLDGVQIFVSGFAVDAGDRVRIDVLIDSRTLELLTGCGLPLAK